MKSIPYCLESLVVSGGYLGLTLSSNLRVECPGVGQGAKI